MTWPGGCTYRCRSKQRALLQLLGLGETHSATRDFFKFCRAYSYGAHCPGAEIIHNIPQVYHIPSPPKYVHVPVPGPTVVHHARSPEGKKS